jgi:FixJ family two-component response regulator
MGRRKDLTEAEKATIIKEIAKGKTTKSIAERINPYGVTVERFLQNPSKRKPPSDRVVRKS